MNLDATFQTITTDVNATPGIKSALSSLWEILYGCDRINSPLLFLNKIFYKAAYLRNTTSYIVVKLTLKQKRLVSINFGHDHDYQFGSKMMSSLPINAVGVMDRGFAGLKFIQELVQENKYFVLRIKNNWKLKLDELTGLVKVGASDDAQAYRVVSFCD